MLVKLGNYRIYFKVYGQFDLEGKVERVERLLYRILDYLVRKVREVLKEGIKGEGDLWKLVGWVEVRVGGVVWLGRFFFVLYLISSRGGSYKLYQKEVLGLLM